MKCKPCWIAFGIFVVIYAADTVYPDWQDYHCGSVNINREEMDKLKGRGIYAPKKNGCKFVPNNMIRDFLNR